MICGLPLHFLFFFKLIYLFLAVLDLHCCVRVFSSRSEQRLLFIEGCRFLIAVASRGAQALGTQASVAVAHRLYSCGTQA